MLIKKITNKNQYKNIKGSELESILNPIILYYLKKDAVKEKDSLKDFINLLEKKLIYTALDVTNGNQKIAAEILGVAKTTLNEKIKRYEVCLDDFKFDMSDLINYQSRTI